MIPQLQMRQIHAKIGIDADLGQQDIRQPKAKMDFEITSPKLEMRQPNGSLEIDSEKAWDALGKGGLLRTMNRIYSEIPRILLEGIARKVEQGNRMGDLVHSKNPIAENAMDLYQAILDMPLVGEAKYDNVDIYYSANRPEINVSLGEAVTNMEQQNPEINYNWGKLDIYQLQKGEVIISPPQIDVKT